MKTKFNNILGNWVDVKNHCRTTVNKKFTDKTPTAGFIKKMLISEHSPIRTIWFDWSWRGIPYWVSTEWSRHKFEKFISSQRDDRNNNDVPRGKKPQDSEVIFDGFANVQNCIDAWRKRLCFMATKEARELAEDFKYELHKTHPLEADVLVKNCVYRCGCPEFESCGYWEKFVERNKEEDLFDIQNRYDIANKEFYSLMKGKEE